MSFTRTAALGLVLIGSLVSAGCGVIPAKKKASLSCSCGGTGCGCSHCTGENTECHCRATDAYPSNRVGEPGD